MPARIRVGERIVHDVAVAVVALQVVRELHERGGLQEAAEGRVVDASVHVDDAHRVDHLVTGEAAPSDAGVESGNVGVRELAPGRRRAALSPGTEAHRLDLVARGVGEDVDTAQVVAQRVVDLGDPGGRRPSSS